MIRLTDTDYNLDGSIFSDFSEKLHKFNLKEQKRSRYLQEALINTINLLFFESTFTYGVLMKKFLRLLPVDDDRNYIKCKPQNFKTRSIYKHKLTH